MGYDIDKNVITRIETQQRYVTDIELQALCQLFNISFEDFVSNKKKELDYERNAVYRFNEKKPANAISRIHRQLSADNRS